MEVENFGEIRSKKGKLSLYHLTNNKKVLIASGTISTLEPFGKVKVDMAAKKDINEDPVGDFEIVIEAENMSNQSFYFHMGDQQ